VDAITKKLRDGAGGFGMTSLKGQTGANQNVADARGNLRKESKMAMTNQPNDNQMAMTSQPNDNKHNGWYVGIDASGGGEEC
jgi:hypothetical protein